MKIADIVGNLPQMTRSDLWKLKVMVDEILRDDRSDMGELDLFFKVMAEELGDVVSRGRNWEKGTTQYKNYKKRFPMVMKFIEQECSTLDKVQRIRFYHILVKAILKYLEDIGLPKSINMISNQFSNINQIIEHSFPGYLKSGLIDKIVKYGD